MGRVLRALCVALLIGGALGVAVATAQAKATRQVRTEAQVVHGLRRGVQWHRSRTWYWQTRAGVARTHSNHAEMRTTSVAYLRWMALRWSKRRVAAHHLAMSRARRTASYSGGIAHERLWLCIHSGEGAWNANTGNGYYGGLQMTAGWYGGTGHLASSDPPSVQMAAAEAQYRASGYSSAWLSGQWPNTYPPCAGLAG